MPKYTKSKHRYTKKKQPKSASAGVQALRIVKSIQKAIEYKHTDYPIPADAIGNVGISYPLVDLLLKGDNATQRTGNTIKLARAHINCTVRLATSSTETFTRSFRIILCRGIRENGSVPVVSYTSSATRGVLDDTSTDLILARKALNNMRDTKFLYDKTYTLSPGTVTSREFKWNFPLHWITTFKEDASGSTEDGGLYLMFAQDIIGQDIIVNLNSRVTFSDL